MIKIINTSIYKIVGFAIGIGLIFFTNVAYSEEYQQLDLEIEYTSGDRINPYQTNYVIYRDSEKTPMLDKILENNPETINLPKDHRYKVEVYVNGMFSEAGYVELQNSPEKLDISIPLPGGLKFKVFFEDKETPIDNAVVKIKSHDGVIQRIGDTNKNGETMRYWLQSTHLDSDYYIAEIYYDDFLLTTVSNVKIHQGIAQEQKIIVPIPAIVENLITFRLYDVNSNKITKQEGDFSVLLEGQNEQYYSSMTNNRGDIYFSSIPSGNYSVFVLNNEVKDPLWPESKIAILGNQNEFDLFQNPATSSLTPVPEPLKKPLKEPVIEPKIYQESTKNYRLSCNCVSFRFDDVQDYWLNNIQLQIFDLFSQNNVPLTSGVIVDSFGDDSRLVKVVKNNLKNNQLEIANHGIDSTPFTVFDKQKQDSLLKESTRKIKEKLNVIPVIFIPPENRFNEDTKQALIDNGYRYLSDSTRDDSPPFPLEGASLYRFPEIATTGQYVPSQNRILGVSSDQTFSDTLNGINDYGFSVITIHPQEFSIYQGGQYVNELNPQQFKELETLIKKIKSQNIDVVFLSEIDKKTKAKIFEKQQDPSNLHVIPSWIKNNAGWWRDGYIDDSSFVNGIQFLIEEKILEIPHTTQGYGGSEIPSWVKENAGWWAEGKITDDDFLYGVNYLVKQGIILANF